MKPIIVHLSSRLERLSINYIILTILQKCATFVYLAVQPCPHSNSISECFCSTHCTVHCIKTTWPKHTCHEVASIYINTFMVLFFRRLPILQYIANECGTIPPFCQIVFSVCCYFIWRLTARYSARSIYTVTVFVSHNL